MKEDEEPVAGGIDTWARKRIRVQAADQEFLAERTTEEKRKLRALQFIEEKAARAEVPRQGMQRLAEAKTGARPADTPSIKADPQNMQEQKKKYTLNKTARAENPEMKTADEDLRARKAQELKTAHDIERRMRADKNLTATEEKKRQKLLHEMKEKQYTYDLKGKIVFLPKEAQKFPEIPAPKTHWTKTEEAASPHYEHFKLVPDSSLVLKEQEKKYKALRTGDIPETVTITLASNKVIKVSAR